MRHSKRSTFAEDIGRLLVFSLMNNNRSVRKLAECGLLMIEYGAVGIPDLGWLRDLSYPPRVMVP